jgi:hypothetical protein
MLFFYYNIRDDELALRSHVNLAKIINFERVSELIPNYFRDSRIKE